MFGFSKKKEGNLQGAPQSAPQTSKIEDDMASFEIPDFSDDDLNFDLGIGEFMPKDALDMQESPKGLPTNPPEKPSGATMQPVNPSPLSQAPQIPKIEHIQFNDEKNNQQTVLEIPKKDLPKIPQVIEEDSKNDITLPEETNNEADFELPKFNMAKAEELPANTDIPKLDTKQPKKSKHHENKHAVKEIKSKPEPKHYAQASPEGFFVPNDIYKKMIVLADDASKKCSSGDDISRHVHVSSKNEKETIFGADKDARAIRDMMLSADMTLFGGK